MMIMTTAHQQTLVKYLWKHCSKCFACINLRRTYENRTTTLKKFSLKIYFFIKYTAARESCGENSSGQQNLLVRCPSRIRRSYWMHCYGVCATEAAGEGHGEWEEGASPSSCSASLLTRNSDCEGTKFQEHKQTMQTDLELKSDRQVNRSSPRCKRDSPANPLQKAELEARWHQVSAGRRGCFLHWRWEVLPLK